MSIACFVRKRGWAALGITILSLAGSGAALGDPPILNRHSAIYDPLGGRMVVFGGDSSSVAVNGTWALSTSLDPQWSALDTGGRLPAARLGHTAVYDAVHHRMIVFGGLGPPGSLNDVWALSLPAPAAWDSLEPTGAPPAARAFHSAIYDPVQDRVLIFGGLSSTLYNDVWCLWLTPSPRWELLTVLGPKPTPRHGHSAIYDSKRGRMIVFGGTLNNDVWSLSLAGTPTWTPLQPSGTRPSPRQFHTAVYDSLEDRMIVFGGEAQLQQNQNDVWSLSLATLEWSQLSPAEDIPSPRARHSAVYDDRYDRMLTYGGDSNLDDPTWGLSLGLGPRWSPLRPVLRVSPNELQVPTVTIGSTVSVPFEIANRGLAPLEIDHVELPTAEMRVNASGPLQLTWGAAAPETLWMAPTTPRLAQDSLVVVSNDPRSARTSIPLRVDVRGLEFSTHVFGDPAEAPLGASLLVVATPGDSVHVEEAKLFYRVLGSGPAFDSLALTRLGTDFIAPIPGSKVTEHGVEYFVRIENHGFFATQPPGAPAVLDTQRVAGPDSLVAIPRSPVGSDFLAGNDIEVDVVQQAGSVFRDGTIHFRRGGESSYESSPITMGSLGPVGVIPGSMVGPTGVEYWIELATLESALRFPAVGSPPGQIPVRVQNLVENVEHPAERYRLLTVPLDFRVFSGSLDALLTDQLGPYDPVYWRVFSYDAGLARNVELAPADTARFRPRPGRAFWLISRATHRVGTGPVDGFSTSTNGEYPIPLLPGWNLVGNPFDFPVAWADVRRNASAVDDPVAFDPTLGTRGCYADGTPLVLAPFEGYFVHASQPETLWVPPRSSSSLESSIASETRGARPARRSAIGDLWRLRVRTWSAEDVDGFDCPNVLIVGVDSKAATGFDRLDLAEPPPSPGSSIQAAFVHRDWNERSGAYRQDLRGPGSDGETWELEIRSGVQAGPVTVGLTDLVPPPSGWAWRLIDREQGSEIDGAPEIGDRAKAEQEGEAHELRYEILPFVDRPYRLAIVAGTPEYIARTARQALAPAGRVSREPCAPNPFGVATRVRFGLPRAAPVRLEIFSVLGERVAQPLDGKAFPAGFHTLVWDGTTQSGQRAPSGVYLVRLVADGEAISRHVVLMK